MREDPAAAFFGHQVWGRKRCGVWGPASWGHRHSLSCSRNGWGVSLICFRSLIMVSLGSRRGCSAPASIVLPTFLPPSTLPHTLPLRSFSCSMHPHGVLYNKSSEGAAYADGTWGADKADDSVPPGGNHTYIWEVGEGRGGGEGGGEGEGWGHLGGG